jgi:PPOX class probable F420-dependent enzyme
MSRGPLPPDIDELLMQANPAVIGTVKPDGSPHTVATWYLWENGEIIVSMDDSRRRLAYMAVGAPVSLTVLAADNWYVHVSFRGRVVELRPDPDLADIDRLSTQYFGRPYHVRDRTRTTARIASTAWSRAPLARAASGRWS